MAIVDLRRTLAGILLLTSAGFSPAISSPAAQPDKIKVPPGFKVQVFKDSIAGARSLALTPSGIVFVGTKSGDQAVYALVDKDKDGRADEIYTIAKGLFVPNGVAFRNGSLYVGEINRVTRYDNIEQHLKDPPAPVVVSATFPDKTHHGWKVIRFGPDDKLYVPVGAPCNVCKRPDPFAGMERMNPDGSKLEMYARGIRNTVGFDWHPVTKQLWFTDNGRDNMNDTTPPDELNCAPQANMHFGFPYYYGDNLPDPEFGRQAPKDLTATPPRLNLGAHVAALGMRFYTGSMFPPEYKNAIFIAEHGSWNSSKKVGYQVICVKLDGDKVVSATPFATGFLQPGEQVIGRPVDVHVMPDGALLVSDDEAGVIYRITYAGPKKAQTADAKPKAVSKAEAKSESKAGAKSEPKAGAKSESNPGAKSSRK
jgi:glucose/arabinose dehydrogenase